MTVIEFADVRIASIRTLVEKFGNSKINLLRPDTSIKEGIWCVGVTEEDNRRMRDDTSDGEEIRVYLVNAPLPEWGGRTWGAEVIGRTCGCNRPKAFPEEQGPLDEDTKTLHQGLAAREAENSAIALLENFGAEILSTMTPEQRAEVDRLLHDTTGAERVKATLDAVEARFIRKRGHLH